MEHVNHPNHYRIDGRKECIEEMRERYGNRATALFCLTNAYKYLYRAGRKMGNGFEQDIAKAEWYFNYAKDKCHCMVTPHHNKVMWNLIEDIERGLKLYD